VLPAYANNDAFHDHSMSQQQKVNRSLFYAILVGISFWLMLVFMTYNGFLMISVVIGAGLGHYAFGSNLPSDRGVQCHWPSYRILATQILSFRTGIASTLTIQRSTLFQSSCFLIAYIIAYPQPFDSSILFVEWRYCTCSAIFSRLVRPWYFTCSCPKRKSKQDGV
jgi:hypothetical protein